MAATTGIRVHLLAASAWDVPLPVGLLVLALAVAGLFAMAWLWRSTAPSRVAAGPPTSGFGDETPAVVDLLTGGFRVDDDAVPATVVDLAARRHLEIEELGGTIFLRPRRHGSHSGEELTPYERRVLDNIEQHAVDGRAPAEAITIGPDGVSKRWSNGFVREVNQHAQSLGLCHRRFDFKHLAIVWAIVVLAAGPAWIVANVAPRTNDPTGWGSLGNLLVGLAFLVGFALVWVAQRVSRSNAQRDTADGRTAAAHWLGVREHLGAAGNFADKPAASVAIWDRHLAYATAMGLAPVVERQLPFETEHDRKVWSLATGTWRKVTVRYRSFVPGWGRHPGKVAFEGLLQGAVTGALAYGAFVVSGTDLDLDTLTDDQRRWIGLGALIVAALAAAVCLFSLAKAALGLSDLFARRTVEGELIRRREFRTGHRLPKVVQWIAWSGRDEYGMRRDHRRRVRHHLAIDEGDDDSIVAFDARTSLFNSVRQGAQVRAVVTPRLGYVRSIEMTAPPRVSAAHAETVHHELVGEAVSTASRAISGRVEQTLSILDTATDEHGRPLLDQTDDDGVSMRERLSEATDQLDQLRHDPRIKNSPFAGLIDSLAGAAATDADDATSQSGADRNDTATDEKS